MPTSTLTSKGQVTIPKEVRDRLHLKTGSRLDFIFSDSGQVILKPVQADFRSIRGIVRTKWKRPISVKKMNEAIAKGYSGT
jgi:AbrB family looped-hinge helix DNA binding protein